MATTAQDTDPTNTTNEERIAHLQAWVSEVQEVVRISSELREHAVNMEAEADMLCARARRTGLPQHRSLAAAALSRAREELPSLQERKASCMARMDQSRTQLETALAEHMRHGLLTDACTSDQAKECLRLLDEGQQAWQNGLF